jgi:hypothetical protein
MLGMTALAGVMLRLSLLTGTSKVAEVGGWNPSSIFGSSVCLRDELFLRLVESFPPLTLLLFFSPLGLVSSANGELPLWKGLSYVKALSLRL